MTACGADAMGVASSTVLSLFLTFLLLAARAVSQVGPTNWTATPFNPPSLPLAVKSPYVNAWAPLGNGPAPLNNAWPRLWDRNLDILGWFAAIRVDGNPFQLLGQGSLPQASQKDFTFTPTRSSVLLQAGPVNVNISFLSPIEATDIVRQSMPFTYMYITVEPNDGNSHSIQVYSDLSGEWIGGSNSLDSNWTINLSSDFIYLQMDLTAPGPFQELNNRPQDGTLYHCMKMSDNVSWQIDNAGTIREAFANGTGLFKTAEAGHHGVGVPYFDTLGISYDFGTISSVSNPAVYALGVVRDPVVQYTNNQVQIEKRSAYYWSQFSNIHDAIEDVLDHFDDALTASINLDNQILGAAGQISSNYGDILRLSTPQTMGALEYTLLRNNSGNFNTSDVKAFMKDMGSIGSGGVSAVDVLYAAMPAYLYLNPNILGYLLSPLMEYQESTQYTNPYAAQDLGGPFPNATGDPNGHDQKIEQSANMLIMSLAHAQASGDGSLLDQHYNLLSGWANYLVNNTMNPGDQTTSTSDAIVVNNQTNVALKGIIGIGAMAKISEYTTHTSDQGRFDGIAKQYVQEWTSIASGTNQLALSFGSTSSGLIYNLYADKLLQLGLLNSSVYNLHTEFCRSQTSIWKYGIPLDSSNSSSVARPDWMMFAAASVTDLSVRDAIITQIHAYISANLQNLPFPALYNPLSGSQIGGEASPALGATFAPLALNLPIRLVSTPGGPNGGGNQSKNVAAIAGAAAGGAAGLAIIVGALIFYRRHRRQQQQQQSISVYNHRTDRIERSKPSSYPSDSILEPLGGAEHRDTLDMRSYPYSPQPSSSASFAHLTATPSGALVPFHLRDLTGRELGGVSNASAVVSHSGSLPLGSSSGSGSTWGTQTSRSPPRTSGKNGIQQEELRSEVDNLRREVERMREERVLLEAPPSYHDGLTHAL